MPPAPITCQTHHAGPSALNASIPNRPHHHFTVNQTSIPPRTIETEFNMSFPSRKAQPNRGQ